MGLSIKEATESKKVWHGCTTAGSILYLPAGWTLVERSGQGKANCSVRWGCMVATNQGVEELKACCAILAPVNAAIADEKHAERQKLLEMAGRMVA